MGAKFTQKSGQAKVLGENRTAASVVFAWAAKISPSMCEKIQTLLRKSPEQPSQVRLWPRHTRVPSPVSNVLEASAQAGDIETGNCRFPAPPRWTSFDLLRVAWRKDLKWQEMGSRFRPRSFGKG